MSDKDYDELHSDLDEEVDEDAFHIGARLDPPQARLYSTQELHTLIHEGVIDLNPPYQRDVVWTEPKQMKLLDSIYRNFYVPPVVFAVWYEDGEEIRRCVDGKQRLTSIQKFFDGQIPYRDPVTKKTYWYSRAESHKASRLEVPPVWKNDFASKQITCVEYRNLPRGFERDIFQRVQLGMPLTAAEKLQAIASPWADWISLMDTRFVSSDNGLTTIIDVDMKRGRDFQSLAQLVYCCDNYPEHSIPTAPKMEQWVARAEHPPHAFKTAINDVLTSFWHIASDRSLNAAFTKIQKRVAPIEFVFIGVVLFVTRDCLVEWRANEIHNMRVYVRKKFADVRSRGDVIRYLWGFVDSVVEHLEDQNSSGRGGDGKKRKGDGYDTSKQVGKRTKRGTR
ncbi:hypothetical protein POSPLADRAFT_1038667 [Postia placenta MAD-698-R-SB12]|uniref:GmrSD restriction endonucleases N-terminal domain-containing protein n=1 Tax=Postia placenta MAD-698-R-SB12 TaxID=670580 RepID=A0A1X6NDE7_9APHY|nr:hypothetical protein POSPLADRAFT_1038667 [Postia placenta MAD-698-R-SB12]OSX66594.1 hypothetical protein POSPLADRAFT_1038667 [Postia placenta MAD-698-R-SB12]